MDVMRAYGGDIANLEIEVYIIKGMTNNPLISGDPREILTKSAEEHNADVIVVGSRGVSAVKRSAYLIN
jgi:hypothetical protein